MRNEMKTKAIIIALGALLLLSGCSRSKVTPDMTTFDMTVRAESDGTRATVNGTTGAFAWEAGDQIAVHLNSGYQSATLTAAGTTTLTAAAGSVRNGYAIYPASVADGTADAPVIILPASYSIASDLQSTSAPLPMVAVNDPDSDLLYFHHVGGLMRITCVTIPAGTKTVTVTMDKGIAGSFPVTGPGTVTPMIAPGGTGTSVAFTVSGDGLASAASNVVLNLPVPCGTYTSMTVDVTPTNASFPVVISSSITIGRAQGLQVKVTPAP